MSNPSIEEQLLAQERKYWSAMQEGDAASAMQVTADPCIVTGASGVSKIDRATLGKMLDAGTWKLEAFELSNPTVLSLTKTVAVLAYKVHEEHTVEDQRLTIDAADSSVWVKRDGQWQCALHTEALLGDPFGRDRQPSNSPT